MNDIAQCLSDKVTRFKTRNSEYAGKPLEPILLVNSVKMYWIGQSAGIAIIISKPSTTTKERLLEDGGIVYPVLNITKVTVQEFILQSKHGLQKERTNTNFVSGKR